MVSRLPATPMTIQHLLSHTAGLTYGGSLPGLELPVDPAYAAAGISRSGNDTLKEFVQNSREYPYLRSRLPMELFTCHRCVWAPN